VSRRNHEVTFLVPMPPAGRWSLRRLGGPRITSAKVSTREENAELEPARELPERTLSLGDGVPLSFEVENAPRGTSVDLYADDDGEGADGFLIASDLPPRAATTWQLSGLGTGRYHVYAIVKRDGVPLESRYWPGAIDVVDPEAPAAPDASAEPHERGALVRWSQVAGAASYSVIARPVPRSAGEQIEETIPAGYDGYVMPLEPGLRYDVFVQAIDGALRRSAERASGTVAVMGPGDPPPAIAGEPNQFARVGEPWAFAPILSDLGGQRVRLRVARGPAGMSASDGVVRWRPRASQVGYTEFTLEAEDSAGGRTRRTFHVLAGSAITAPPPPPSGLTVAPAAVPARRSTVLTISGQGFDRRTRAFAGRTRLRRVHVEDANTLTARVRCLRPGAHTISIRRGDGTRESLPRGLTVTGRRCRGRR
jgi:hypothetical protein